MAALTDETALMQRQKKDQTEKLKQQGILLAKAVKSLYATYEGRTLLNWLLAAGRALGDSSFRGDPYRTAFACGENNVGLKIMALMISTDPGLFAELLKEQNNARSSTVTVALANSQPDSDADSEPEPNSEPDTSTYT